MIIENALTDEEQPECKSCEYFSLYDNTCLIDCSQGYEKGECLHPDCKNYTPGTWSPQ